jgi:hypothetical protein
MKSDTTSRMMMGVAAAADAADAFIFLLLGYLFSQLRAIMLPII